MAGTVARMRPPQPRRARACGVALLLAVAVAACSPEPTTQPGPSVAPTSAAQAQAPAKPQPSPQRRSKPKLRPAARPSDARPAKPGPRTPVTPVSPRPNWLGTRVLPKAASGYGEIRPTPPVLRDRRFATIDLLPAPPHNRFTASVGPVPDDVIGRSTWSSACPVAREDLRYVTVTFRGFDGLAHTGELLLHRTVADNAVRAFRALYRIRFPIEEMRVVGMADLSAPPTGDGNYTTAFVCRPARGSTSWSQHAYGLAVDINPFHNPYVRNDAMLPELASAYTDRGHPRPGMLLVESEAVAAMERNGWEWGGTWSSLKDWMHFSVNGR